MAAEAHAKLPRRLAKSIGAIYVRYSTEFQDSAEDQIRALFQFAVANGIFVPREFVYFDLGVRGYTSSREGLNQLRGTLAVKKVDVLLLFATNRLYRKVFLTLQFVEQVVKEWGIRCVFVKSDIDTAKKDQWQHLLHFRAMLDEFQVSVNAEHVRAALEGLFLEGLVFGTITFGYAGEEIAGKKTKRGLPRRRLVIDARESEIVRLIFHLFVHERLSIRNIARRLNSIPDVPLPRKARHLWTPNSVRRALKRPAYRGHFVFSVTEKCFIASKDYTRQIPRDLPLAEKDFEYLRIIADVDWYAAQVRLADNKTVSGRPTKDGTPSPMRVLAGLFRCPEHDRALRSGLAFGKYMYCPVCDLLEAHKRTLYSKLNRKLALELLCNKLQELILQDSELVGRIIAACQMAAAEIQQPDTSEAEVLKCKLSELTRVIDFNRRNPGQTDEDQKQQQCLIGELERERSGVRAKISRLEATAKLPIQVPSLEEAQQLVADLSQVFQNAAAGDLGDEQDRVREILWSLTGGQIDLFQMGPAEPIKGWLQGRFQVHLLRTLVTTACGSSENIPDVPIDVVIDFKRPRKSDSDADTAIQLWLDGYLNQEIAEMLCVGASYISRILRLGAERMGT
ncbi:MAG: recombinase family protein, partial [Planctomycetaceae bacterium]